MSESKKILSAVALKYEPEKNKAPQIVASGTGYRAQRILSTAVENGIAVYHDESAATLLSKLEMGDEIPEVLYKIVADIYVSILELVDENNIMRK